MDEKTERSLEAQKGQLEEELKEIYTPSTAIKTREWLSGRKDILNMAWRDLTAGRSLVVYGKPGVGKTSFCNVLLQDRRAVKHDCSGADTFVTIFLDILRQLGAQFTEREMKSINEAGYSIGKEGIVSVTVGKSDEFTSREVAEQTLDVSFMRQKLAKVSTLVNVVYLDEFQKVESSATQQTVLELVKQSADRGIDVRFVISAVTDSDRTLFPSKAYTEMLVRYITALQIPVMKSDELTDILVLRQTWVKFPEEHREMIARVSCGYPSVIHELALSASLSWLGRKALQRLAEFLQGSGWLNRKIRSLLRGWNVPLRDVGIEVEKTDMNSALQLLNARLRRAFQEEISQYDMINNTENGERFARLIQFLASANTEVIEAKDLRVIDPDGAALLKDLIMAHKADRLIRSANDRFSLVASYVGPYSVATEVMG